MNSSAGLSMLSVFLVEPSATQARFVQTKLGELGIPHTKVFKDGAAALAAMREQQPDLVVSAMYLEDISGSQLVEKMRADEALKAVAFILISSESNPHYLDPVRQAGACAILPKPFETEQLRVALSSTLDYLNPSKLKVEGDIDLENLRVLMVDDSRSARNYLKQVLGNLGINHITEAENGRQAVGIINAQLFDLIITDYNMPEMNGQELIEFIRGQSWQSSVPVIMVSSERNEQRLAAVEQAGVSAICDKPFEPAFIKNLLEKILSQ